MNISTFSATLAAFPIAFAAVAATAAPIQWATADGGNGHYYEFVLDPGGQTIAEVEAAAEASAYLGLSGYLATITSQAEQAFLNSIWPGAGSVAGQFGDYSYFLIGASDRDSEGTFEWIGGPEEGQALTYSNWAFPEPNNNLGAEDYTVAWWQDSATGAWNDAGLAGDLAPAYLVEYSGTQTPAVPLPAGLPLLVAGLGGIAALRRFG